MTPESGAIGFMAKRPDDFAGFNQRERFGVDAAREC